MPAEETNREKLARLTSDLVCLDTKRDALIRDINNTKEDIAVSEAPKKLLEAVGKVYNKFHICPEVATVAPITLARIMNNVSGLRRFVSDPPRLGESTNGLTYMTPFGQVVIYACGDLGEDDVYLGFKP